MTKSGFVSTPSNRRQSALTQSSTVVRIIAVGSEVTVHWQKKSVCVCVSLWRNVLRAGLFTQDPVHIFCETGERETGEEEKEQPEAAWGLQWTQTEVWSLSMWYLRKIPKISTCWLARSVVEAMFYVFVSSFQVLFTSSGLSGGYACAALLLGDNAALRQALFRLTYPV